MKDFGETSRKKSKRTAKVNLIAFCIFFVIFAFSAFIVIINKHEDIKAANSYSQLKRYIREVEYSNESKNASVSAPDVNETAAHGQIIVETVPVISMDFAPLKEINSDIIGWIQSDGTNIDYPIVRAEDNEYYLNHLYNHESNSHGAIFADYRNDGDFSDRNTVIYGHHMENGTMFAALSKYKSQEFYDSNPTMIIYTPQGDYTVEFICGTVENGDYEFVRFEFDSDEDFLNYIEGFRERSTFVSDAELQPGDRVVSLCTCSYENTNARFMVIGKLVPLTESAVRAE